MRVRVIAVDADYRMRVDALEQAVAAEPTSRPIGDLRPPRARIHRPPTSTAE